MTYRREPATRPCSGHALPGTVEGQNQLLRRVKGTTNLGVYVCKNIAGKSSPSVHGNGRAADTGCPSQTVETPQGLAVVDDLLRLHDALQVQTIIHARRIWTIDKPYWRPYSSTPDPHFNHVHWEVTTWGGNLSAARVAAVYATLDHVVPPPRPRPPRTPSGVLGAVLALVAQAKKQVLKRGDRGFYVTQLQRLLTAKGFPCGKIDGDFGPATERAVSAFQKSHRLPQTGVVTASTWAALGL